MNETNITTAEAYYQGFNDNDIAAIGNCLDPAVQFIAPMGDLSGKDAVLEAAKRHLLILKNIKIREKFSSGDKVMLVYDLTFGSASAICPTAVLMQFKDKLITRLELYYDARQFVK